MADVAQASPGSEPAISDPAKATNKQKARKRKFKSRSQVHKEKQPRPDYQPIVKDNENLVKYYRAQTIFEPDEFDTFMHGLRETLPASFRINTFDVNQANFLRKLVEDSEFDDLLVEPPPPAKIHAEPEKDEHSEQGQPAEPVQGQDITLQKPAERIEENQDENEEELKGDPNSDDAKQDDKQAALEPLCWYPKRLAWQMNMTRLDLRKSPILQQLHKFLMAETDNGFISRQEAVSMLPPLVLDIHQGQNILDMCAAPGSKTAQLLEYLKCDVMAPELEPSKSFTDDPFDDGLVVANDVDNKRCYMLVHQSSRLNSPNCIIINQDAGRLPNLKTLVNDHTCGDQFVNLKFDRILCDVPCSGDGTVRKNPDVWKKWSVGNANNFHGMQCKILRRGVELLKEGGLLAYSTCSMNPVEDEAVIASVLRASKGSVILEDIAHKLPGLKFRSGVSKWTVMNREMEVMATPDQVPAENLTQIYPSLFQPSSEESQQFQLHKCIRILPHFQNTGGFFVAVLRKVNHTLPWEEVPASKGESNPSEETAQPTKALSQQKQPQQTHQHPNPKKRRYAGFREDPFVFMDSQDADWVAIKKVYGISENFPLNQLVHRCTSGKKRSIYLVSKRTRSFIIANREEPERKDFVKIINGGMRLFSRADTEAGFRICQDGVKEVLPFIKDEIKVALTEADLIALLKARTVPIEELSGRECIKARIKQGSFIFIYKHEPSNVGVGDSSSSSSSSSSAGGKSETRQASFEMPLVAWRGEWTVALYVSNTYRVHLSALAKLRISDVNGIVKQETTVAEQQ